MYERPIRPNELYHYGVLGMRWGVRRYQNYDGTRIGTGSPPVTKSTGSTKQILRNKVNENKQLAKEIGRSFTRGSSTVAGGQGGKAKGNARFAASAGGSDNDNKGSDSGDTKKMSKGEKIFGPNVKKGKGKDNSSVAVELSRSVKEGAESGRDLVKLAKNRDKKLQEQNAKQRATQTKKAQKMSDKELRDSINRIKMEREYVSLTTKETQTGYDKADKVLETVGKVAATGVAVGTFILTLYKIKKTLFSSDESADQLAMLYAYGVDNNIPKDVIEHAMQLDLDYVLDYYDLTEEDIEHALENDDELYHHGILGMKWGVRRYQNYDGTRIGTGHGTGGGGGGSSTKSKSLRDYAYIDFYHKDPVTGKRKIQFSRTMPEQAPAKKLVTRIKKVVDDPTKLAASTHGTPKAESVKRLAKELDNANKESGKSSEDYRDRYAKYTESLGEYDPKDVNKWLEARDRAVKESRVDENANKALKLSSRLVKEYGKLSYNDIDDDILKIGEEYSELAHWTQDRNIFTGKKQGDSYLKSVNRHIKVEHDPITFKRRAYKV